MLTDYSRPLRVCLAFLAAPPQRRTQLLPDAWAHPVTIDNGYAFHAEQPREVMADFCGEWLRLQECWEDIPAYTALALQPEATQAAAEAQIGALRERVRGLNWREWAESDADRKVARAVLDVLGWSAELTKEQLYDELDTHTYGTFSAALARG